MKTKLKILSFSLLLLSVFSSCITSTICQTPSLSPMQNKTISEDLGQTFGSDWAVSVLGIYMIGRPDIDLAIEQAKSSKNADTLVDVSCYESYAYFILFSISIVRIEGKAVRLSDNPKPEQKGKTK